MDSSQDSDLVDRIIWTALLDHPSVEGQLSLLGRVEDAREVEEWHGVLVSVWHEAGMPIPGGSIEDYAFAAFAVEPRSELTESESPAAQATMILTLSGHDLGPDRHNSRSYHWVGLYAFDEAQRMMGYGWWSASVSGFEELSEKVLGGAST